MSRRQSSFHLSFGGVLKLLAVLAFTLLLLYRVPFEASVEVTARAGRSVAFLEQPDASSELQRTSSALEEAGEDQESPEILANRKASDVAAGQSVLSQDATNANAGASDHSWLQSSMGEAMDRIEPSSGEGGSEAVDATGEEGNVDDASPAVAVAVKNEGADAGSEGGAADGGPSTALGDGASEGAGGGVEGAGDASQGADAGSEGGAADGGPSTALGDGASEGAGGGVEGATDASQGSADAPAEAGSSGDDRGDPSHGNPERSPGPGTPAWPPHLPKHPWDNPLLMEDRERTSWRKVFRLSGVGTVCIRPSGTANALEQSVEGFTREGLPPWPAPPGFPMPRKDTDGSVKFAYLIQVCRESKLTLTRRTYNRLYDTNDVFLYLVDRKLLDPKLVEEALIRDTQRSLPRNVFIQLSAHAGYFYWPRVKVVLDGIVSLLRRPEPWDFLIHLSESDYPVHSQTWLRAMLGRQRESNFIAVTPRCWREDWPPASASRRLAALSDANASMPRRLDGDESAEGGGDGGESKPPEPQLKRDPWWFWTQTKPVASCGDKFKPKEVRRLDFPMEALERRGFIFARESEWVIVTRKLADYAVGPGLDYFNNIVGMHAGADEIFWPSLVLNIPGFTQKVSKQGWYIRWPQAGNGHSPCTIGDEFRDELMTNRDWYLFTRKVDEDTSHNIMSLLDRAGKMEEHDLSGGTWRGTLSLDEASLEIPMDRDRMHCYYD